uniref:Putative calcin-like n=1 Tax=Superstitionia donensis TaxID=311983 RepID=A0A1V1WBN6_9SCOR
MKTSVLSIILIVTLVAACFVIDGAEANNVRIVKRSCLENRRICKTNNDCCSKKCVRRGRIPSKKCE